MDLQTPLRRLWDLDVGEVMKELMEAFAEIFNEGNNVTYHIVEGHVVF